MQLAVTGTANGNASASGWYTYSAGCMSSTVIPALAPTHDNQHEMQTGPTKTYLKECMYKTRCAEIHFEN